MGLVDQLNAEFDQMLREMAGERDLALMQRELRDQLFRREVTISGRPIPTFIKPFFMTTSQAEMVRRHARNTMSALEKVTDLYWSDRESFGREFFALDDAEELLVEIDPGYRRKVWRSRFDCFMGEDWVKFIEFNCDSPGGPMNADVLQELMNATGIMRAFSDHHELTFDVIMPRVEAMLMQAWEDWGGSGRPNIAICAGPESGTYAEFILISRWLRMQGYECRFCPPYELKYDRGRLWARGMPTDMIYRRGWIKDWTGCMQQLDQFVQAYRDGKVCVVNPPRSIIADHKSLLELIQLPEVQQSAGFTAEEKDSIAAAVPWTQRVEPERWVEFECEKCEIGSLLRRFQKRFVLKPVDMYGGQGVYVGRDMEPEAWDQAVAEAESGRTYHYIAQEYVPIPELDFPTFQPNLAFEPKKINMNFYVMQGEYIGGFVRLSDSSIINVSAGGGLAPIYVAEG